MLAQNALKLSFISLSAAVLIACGSGKAPVSSSQGEISGSAVKGLIANGKVELFGIANGAKQLLDSTLTGVSGDYLLDVPDNYTGPVLLEVTALAGTTMLCDAPAGCGNVAFGADMPLNVGTRMKAVMRNVLPNQPVNIYVTPLTHMAAAHAETAGLSTDSIIAANEKVASLFKLPGDFLSVEPANVVDADSLAVAASSSVNYGVLAAAFAGGSATELEARLSSYASAFATDQLLEDSSDANAATLRDIFEPAASLAAYINSGDVEAQYNSLIAGLSLGGAASTGTSGSTNSSLDDMLQGALDDVTRLSGTINDQALQDYLQSQADQLGWILTPELLNTVLSSVNVVKEVMYVALGHDYLVTMADANGIVDRSSVSGGAENVEVFYNVNTKLLSFKTLPGKTLIGHQIDFDVQVHPVSNGVLLGTLPYTLKAGGAISNAQFTASFTKDSYINFTFEQQDDFSGVQNLLTMLYALIGAAQNPNMDFAQQQAMQFQLLTAMQALPAECAGQAQGTDIGGMLGMIDCVLGDFITGLDASGYLEFGMLVSKTDDSTQQFDVDFKGFADINFTDTTAATVARLEIQDGHLYTPNGDRLFTVDGAKGLVLDLGNTDNAMFARFGIDSVLIPEIHVTLRGTFPSLQAYLDLFNGAPLAFDFNELQLANVLQKPFQTGFNFLSALLQPEAASNTIMYLLANTTPRDYISTLAVGLEVQPDAVWPSRRYDVEFVNNELHLTNQDGISFVYRAEQGAIVSVIRAFGNDLVTVRVTDAGVSVTDIDDQITLDVNNLPVAEMMSLYARLGILIDLDEQAQALLDSYSGSAASIDLGSLIGG